MPLIFNGNPNPTTVMYNGISVDRVIWNGNLVWQKTPTVKTVKPDILTPNSGDITTDSVIWYVRNDDSIPATIYSRLSNEASYTSVANVAAGATAQFTRSGLLDKHTYTIQAYALATDRLTSDDAIEEQFTTATIYYGVKWYDGYDAAPYFSQQVEKGLTVNALDAPPVPTEINVGYEFDYWSVGGVQATFPYTINSNTNFVAVWKAVSYTVIWKDWDGTTKKTQTVGSNYYLTTADQPAVSRTGYTHSGWSPTLPRYITANTTLTAQYTINQYNLRWYDGDGIVMKSTNVNYNTYIDSSYQPSPLPTLTGYTFTGWSPALPFYMPANTVNVYSQFSPNSYTITWKNWDGTVLKTQTLETGYYITTADQPTATRTGYTFTGWSPTIPRYVVDANITFTAQFSINTYTCLWYYGDGAATSRTYDYGTVISTAAIDPGEVSCKYFTGWSPTLPHTITGAVNFTPQYSYYVYTITWVDGFGNTIKTKTYNCGSTCVSGDYPANPANSTCHTFAGWDKSWGFAVYQNWTITATWSLNYFTINWYNFSGAVIKTLSKCCGCYVDATEYPGNPPTPSCTVWNGWNKAGNFYVYQNWNISPNTPNPATPGVPSSMSGSSPANNRLSLSWGTGTCASSYTYQYKLTTSSTWTSGSTTGTSVSNIVVGAGTYDIQVKSVNGTASSTYRVGLDVVVKGVIY